MSIKYKRKLCQTDFETNCESKRPHSDTKDMETTIFNLINEVLTEEIGKLIILVQDESPYVVLQNAVAYSNMNLVVFKENQKENYELHINGKPYASGTFQNIQIAKKELAEQALDKLKETCFFIYKKKDFVNVTKKNLQASTSSGENSAEPIRNVESIAHKIMMKMGWNGGGLGAHEQGKLDTVMLSENVNRQGLGTSNLMTEITKKVEDFSKTSNLLTLVFDAEFTKEERMLIHKVARKYNLKSKSTGSETRRLIVSKKVTRMDIVKELLKIGGEDGFYKLLIPTKFKHLWKM